MGLSSINENEKEIIMNIEYKELSLKYVRHITNKYAKLGKTVEQNYRYIIRNCIVCKDQRKLLRKELKNQ